MIKFLFFLISFCPMVVQSQPPRADSLKNKTNYFTDKMEEDEIITLRNQLNVDTIRINHIKIKRNVFSSEKLYRSNRLKVAIFANDTWKMKKAGPNLLDEFYFKNIVFGTIAHFVTYADTNRSQQHIVNNILNGTRDKDFDAYIVNSEYRIVNENKILFIEIDEKIKKFEVRTLYYLFFSKEGLTQISLSLLRSQLKDQRSEMEAFLNGFVITENE